MQSLQEFEGLYGVTEETALNFWGLNIREITGEKRWSQIRSSTGWYLASVLGHFCLQPVDRTLARSPNYDQGRRTFRQFADLQQIAELMMQRMTIFLCPRWMESAGAHVLLYAGFFYPQNKNRHNIHFYAGVGKECYRMAAVGKREKVMKLVARGFDEYLFYLGRLQAHLREKNYLLPREFLTPSDDRLLAN